MRTKWTVAPPMLFGGRCSHAQVFDRKADAVVFANQENRRCPEHRGRGIKAVPCDEQGNIDWKRVR